jgi:hypothetical protein
MQHVDLIEHFLDELATGEEIGETRDRRGLGQTRDKRSTGEIRQKGAR